RYALSRLALRGICRIINSTIGSWWSPCLLSLLAGVDNGVIGIAIGQHGWSPLPLICVSSIWSTRNQHALDAIETVECPNCRIHRVSRSDTRNLSGRLPIKLHGPCKIGKTAPGQKASGAKARTQARISAMPRNRTCAAESTDVI